MIQTGVGKSLWLHGHKTGVEGLASQTSQGQIHIYSALLDAADGIVQVVIELADEYEQADLVGLLHGVQGNEVRLKPDSQNYFRFDAEGTWPILVLRFNNLPSWTAEGVDMHMAIGAGESDTMSSFVALETIEVPSNAIIGACVSPLFAHTPTLHDWMSYHISLGVSEFSMYIPHARFIDEEEYNNVGGSAPLKGGRSQFHVQPFHSKYVAWHHYAPRPESFYFGQLATYNDCVFRNRKKYEFTMLLDTDEFVVLREPPTLLPFLRQYLSPEYSNIRLPNHHTVVRCPVEEGMQVVEDFDIFSEPYPEASTLVVREGEEGGTANWNTGSKTIIRPLNVLATHTHGPVYLEEHIQKDFLVDREKGGMRHVRCHVWSKL